MSGVPEHSMQTKASTDEATRVLLDLAFALGATSSGGEAVGLILDAAMKIDGVDCGGIYLLEGESGTLRLAHHVGLSPDFVRQESRFAADTPENRLVRGGEPLYGTLKEMGQPANEIRHREGLTAIAVLPLQHGGKTIGSLNLASRRPDGIPSHSR
jgi:transcriptional regulator with GAF, ATPase, and Fis domain